MCVCVCEHDVYVYLFTDDMETGCDNVSLPHKPGGRGGGAREGVMAVIGREQYLWSEVRAGSEPLRIGIRWETACNVHVYTHTDHCTLCMCYLHVYNYYTCMYTLYVMLIHVRKCNCTGTLHVYMYMYMDIHYIPYVLLIISVLQLPS